MKVEVDYEYHTKSRMIIRAGDIGKTKRRIEFEPFPEEAPLAEPAAPEPVTEPVTEPAAVPA